MWDLKTIIKINEIAHELSEQGKSPSGAIHELSKRRSKAAKAAKSETEQKDAKSKQVTDGE